MLVILECNIQQPKAVIDGERTGTMSDDGNEQSGAQQFRGRIIGVPLRFVHQVCNIPGLVDLHSKSLTIQLYTEYRFFYVCCKFLVEIM